MTFLFFTFSHIIKLLIKSMNQSKNLNLLSMSFCASVNFSVFESSRRCTLNWVSMSGKLMRRRGSGLGVPVIRSLTPSTTTTTCRCLTARCSCFDWALDSMREAEEMVMAKRSSRRASSPAPAIAGLLLRPVSRRPPSSCPPLLSLPPVSCLHTCFSHPHLPPLPTLGRRFLVDCCPPRFLCLPVLDCDLPRLASQRWQVRSKLPRPPVISPLHLDQLPNCPPCHHHRRHLQSGSPRHCHCDRQWGAGSDITRIGSRCTWLGTRHGQSKRPLTFVNCVALPNILSAKILLHQF